MGMTNTVCELKKSMNDTMNVLKRKLGEEMFDCEVEPELFEMMRGLFHMCDLSMELMEQQAKTIEGIDEKLDKLLERKDEA